MSLTETLAKPLLTGAIAAGLSYVLFDGSTPIPIGGMEIPGALFVGITVAASDYVGEIGKNYVLPMIPGNSEYSKLEVSLVQPVLTGAWLAGGFWMLGVSESGNLLPVFTLGAGSAIAGDYAYRNFIAHPTQ